MSNRNKIRKRSEKETSESKKIRKSNSKEMADKTVGTKDSKEDHHITDEAWSMMSQLHIVTIEKTTTESMDSRMEQWLKSKKYLESQVWIGLHPNVQPS